MHAGDAVAKGQRVLGEEGGEVFENAPFKSLVVGEDSARHPRVVQQLLYELPPWIGPRVGKEVDVAQFAVG